MSKHIVGLLEELPPGHRKRVSVKGRDIVIFNIEGDLVALLNRCPHRGGDLCKGRLTGLVGSCGPGHYEYTRQGEILRCPWHGWEFDIRTGKSVFDPDGMRARTYDVDVATGETIDAQADYALELYPVQVDRKYVAVILPDRSK